jgi:hypothetical protein
VPEAPRATGRHPAPQGTDRTGGWGRAAGAAGGDTGPYVGRGPRRKYGRKVDYTNIPETYLKETTVKEDMQTRLYQAQLLHKEFTQPLNVVIIVKTNLRTQAQAHVVLFSSDLTLTYAPLVDYYGLRFQIEFNFLDTKQYWVLEDFMNVTPTGVTNAATLILDSRVLRDQ